MHDITQNAMCCQESTVGERRLSLVEEKRILQGLMQDDEVTAQMKGGWEL